MSHASSSADAFARVRAALLAVWPTVADRDAGLTRAELGRLLDECGSDHRPLAELLLDLGRLVRPGLAGVGPQRNETWVHTRAPLVHKVVSTRYLQPDVARWAVDVWGAVLGVAPQRTVASPTLEQVGMGVDMGDSRQSPEASGSLGGPVAAKPLPSPPVPRSSPRPPVLAPQQVPAAMRQRPSWAGGPVSFGVGQRPTQAGLAALAQSGRVVVRAPVAPGPMFQPAERRAAAVLGVLLVLITGGLMRAFSRRPDVITPVDAARDSTAMAGDPTPTLVPVAPVPGARAVALAPGGAPATVPAPATAPVPAAAPTPAPAAPAASVPVTARVVWSGTVRDRGIAGTYLVQSRVRDVSGSTSCEAVATALAAGRESEEIVSHVPGQSSFTIVTRGVAGTLDADGQFVSELRAGTTNNVNWRFRMSGRFGPNGFTGSSVTLTDAILRWGKIQTCVVTADLTGHRRLH